MRLLIDLTHPAHAYVFKEMIYRLQAEGHEVELTGRHKDILVEVCRDLGFDVEFFGRARKGIVNLAAEFPLRQARLYTIIRRFRPHAIMSIAGAYVTPIGRALGIPTYIFYDTEHATISNLIAYPFATCSYIPRCYRGELRWRHERYDGYHELAYLHPCYFQADPAVLGEAGVEAGELFSVIRFVGWGAAHDVGLQGFSADNKIRAVQEMKRFGRVFISAEGDLPPELEPDRLRLGVTRIHHLMAHAALVFGESATMASEAAVLGVPSVFVDAVGRGYTDEQESRYGLVFNFKPERQNDAIDKAVEVLTDYDRAVWKERGRRLVAEKIDVTEMMHRIALERPYAGNTAAPSSNG